MSPQLVSINHRSKKYCSILQFVACQTTIIGGCKTMGLAHILTYTYMYTYMRESDKNCNTSAFGIRCDIPVKSCLGQLLFTCGMVPRFLPQYYNTRAQSTHSRPRYTVPQPRGLSSVDAGPVTIEYHVLPLQTVTQLSASRMATQV